MLLAFILDYKNQINLVNTYIEKVQNVLGTFKSAVEINLQSPGYVFLVTDVITRILNIEILNPLSPWNDIEKTEETIFEDSSDIIIIINFKWLTLSK